MGFKWTNKSQDFFFFTTEINEIFEKKSLIIPLGVFVCERMGMQRGDRSPHVVILHVTPT